MCVAWLLGKCHFAARCFYAHDRAYLAHGGWWNDRAKVRGLAADFKECVNSGLGRRFETEVFFSTLGMVNEWRSDGWVSERFSGLDDEPVPTERFGVDGAVVDTTTRRNSQFRSERSRNTRPARGRARAAGRRYHGGHDWDDDYEERANMFGFDDDDVNELLCQGVKPWDDDAWVRNAFPVLVRREVY